MRTPIVIFLLITAAIEAAVASDAPPSGWVGQYYNNQTMSGDPVLRRIDGAINFDWGRGSPSVEVEADHFSVRWLGSLQPQVTAMYRFQVEADDGIRLLVDGKVLINAWKDQAPTVYTADIVLESGRAYSLSVDYYENGGGAVAKIKWGAVGSPLVLLDSSVVSQDHFSLNIPYESQISPASLEGTSFAGPVSAKSWFKIAHIQNFGIGRFHGAISLSAYLPTPVTFAVDGEIRKAGLIRWKPTLLERTSQIELAAGESLCFEALRACNWTISHDSGIYKADAKILPFERKPVQFTKSGTYRVQSFNGGGKTLGDITVKVTSLTLSRRACEIGHTTSYQAAIAGDASVSFDATDGILDVALKSVHDKGVDLSIRPTGSGSPTIVARMSGRIVGLKIIDEYTIKPDWHHHFMYHVDESGFGHGHFGFTLSPKIDYVDVTVDFFVPTCTINGKSKFTIPGAQLDDVGHWEAEFSLAPGADKTCHRYLVTQRP